MTTPNPSQQSHSATNVTADTEAAIARLEGPDIDVDLAASMAADHAVARERERIAAFVETWDQDPHCLPDPNSEWHMLAQAIRDGKHWDGQK